MAAVEISFEDAGVVRATLVRPEKRNALTLADVDILLQAFMEAAARAELPVVIIEAIGPVFCAGADKSLLENLSLAEVQSNTRKFTELLHRFETLPNITVVSLKGHAVGLGMHLALAADFLLLKEDVELWAPEFKLGLPDVGHHHLLSSRLGKGRALGVSLFGDRLDSKMVCAAGLAYASFPDERALCESTNNLVDRLTSLSPELRRVTKAAYLKSHIAPDGDLQVTTSVSCLLETAARDRATSTANARVKS